MDSPRILDETPPVVHITYPANQSIVSGSVLITAYAFDNNKLENVKLYLDDAIIFQGDTEPYEVIWNTLMFQEEENYIISATAEDSSGNKTYSSSIEVKLIIMITLNQMEFFFILQPGKPSMGLLK